MKKNIGARRTVLKIWTRSWSQKGCKPQNWIMCCSERCHGVRNFIRPIVFFLFQRRQLPKDWKLPKGSPFKLVGRVIYIQILKDFISSHLRSETDSTISPELLVERWQLKTRRLSEPVYLFCCFVQIFSPPQLPLTVLKKKTL